MRALVHSKEKAQKVLGCIACDQSEGIFVGDVTKPDTLTAVFAGAAKLAIATGVYGVNDTTDMVRSIEWDGVRNMIESLAARKGGSKHVVMISSEGSTSPPEGTTGDALVLFYKLQAEAFLMSSNLPFTIIQPCGLTETAGGKRELLTGHDDAAPWSEKYYLVPRADVAGLAINALANSALSQGLRFNFCSKEEGTGKGAYDDALKSARWSWEKSTADLVV